MSNKVKNIDKPITINEKPEPHFTSESEWQTWKEIERYKLEVQLENSKNVKMWRQIHNYLRDYYGELPSFELKAKYVEYAQSVYNDMLVIFDKFEFSYFDTEDFVNPYTQLWDIDILNDEDCVYAEIGYNCVAPYAAHLNEYYRGYQLEKQELNQ